MTPTDIEKLLKNGEHLTLECKRCTDRLPNSLWETYSAFANSYGGIILLGIEEHYEENHRNKQFSIHGVIRPDKLIADFWNLANDPNKVNINLLNDDDIEIVEIDSKPIIVIRVPRAPYNNRPVFVNHDIQRGTYRRNYEGDYHCSESELRMLLRDANDKGNDMLLLEHYSLDDIDTESLRGYRQMFITRNADHWLNNLDNKNFLIQLGGYTVNRQTSEEGLTMAGLLMFGKGLAIRERFDNIRLDYVDKTRLIGDMRYSDRLTYDFTWENNLFQFFMLTMPRLSRELPRPFVLDGIQRQDDTPAHRTLREAFTNMIIHSDFMITGVLRVEKREDGFFFSNPGLLRLPVDEIYQGGVSLTRNPRIQNMMRMIGFGENLGTGFPAIVSAWEQTYHLCPILSERPSIFATELLLPIPLVVPQNNPQTVPQNNPQTVLQNMSRKLTKRQQFIFTFIQSNPTMTKQQIADALGLGIGIVKRELSEMSDMIHHVGASKGGHWEIIRKISTE